MWTSTNGCTDTNASLGSSSQQQGVGELDLDSLDHAFARKLSLGDSHGATRKKHSHIGLDSTVPISEAPPAQLEGAHWGQQLPTMAVWEALVAKAVSDAQAWFAFYANSPDAPQADKSEEEPLLMTLHTSLLSVYGAMNAVKRAEDAFLDREATEARNRVHSRTQSLPEAKDKHASYRSVSDKVARRANTSDRTQVAESDEQDEESEDDAPDPIPLELFLRGSPMFHEGPPSPCAVFVHTLFLTLRLTPTTLPEFYCCRRLQQLCLFFLGELCSEEGVVDYLLSTTAVLNVIVNLVVDHQQCEWNSTAPPAVSARIDPRERIFDDVAFLCGNIATEGYDALLGLYDHGVIQVLLSALTTLVTEVRYCVEAPNGHGSTLDQRRDRFLQFGRFNLETTTWALSNYAYIRLESEPHHYDAIENILLTFSSCVSVDFIRLSVESYRNILDAMERYGSFDAAFEEEECLQAEQEREEDGEDELPTGTRQGWTDAKAAAVAEATKHFTLQYRLDFLLRTGIVAKVGELAIKPFVQVDLAASASGVTFTPGTIGIPQHFFHGQFGPVDHTLLSEIFNMLVSILTSCAESPAGVQAFVNDCAGLEFFALRFRALNFQAEKFPGRRQKASDAAQHQFTEMCFALGSIVRDCRNEELGSKIASCDEIMLGLKNCITSVATVVIRMNSVQVLCFAAKNPFVLKPITERAKSLLLMATGLLSAIFSPIAACIRAGAIGFHSLWYDMEQTRPADERKEIFVQVVSATYFFVPRSPEGVLLQRARQSLVNHIEAFHPHEAKRHAENPSSRHDGDSSSEEALRRIVKLFDHFLSEEEQTRVQSGGFHHPQQPPSQQIPAASSTPASCFASLRDAAAASGVARTTASSAPSPSSLSTQFRTSFGAAPQPPQH